MSYYEPQSPAGWQQNQSQSRQSWDTRSTVSTPGQASFNKNEVHGNQVDLTTRFTAQMKPEDPAAFGSQLDEVDRAVDNLVKSGKMFSAPRRDSMPMMGPRGFPVETHDPRMPNPVQPRQYSATEFEGIRSPSAANLQNFYATQRFQPRQGAEPETVIQAKRRAAAQRERELRNYHQEQQYNRTVLAEITPFEDGSNPHHDEGSNRGGNNLNVHSNGTSAPASNAGGTRGPSPMHAFDAFRGQGSDHYGSVDGYPVQTPSSEHPPSGTQSTGTVSPSHARTNSGVHGLSSRTTASSPGGSPPRSNRGSVGPGSSAVAPIGTRPAQNPAVSNAKRATTPLASPLSYGFGASEADPFNNHNKPNERSASAASNNEQSSVQGSESGLGWSKVWGPGNKGLNNVASVWG